MLALEDVDGKAGRHYFLAFKDEAAGERPTFLERLKELDGFVGDAPVVVHNAAQWRKYMRPELRRIKNRRARRWLKQTIDVYRWAHQRFPKQRKDIAAIAQRLSIVVDADLVGLRAQAELLRLIAQQMNGPKADTAPPSTAAPAATPAPARGVLGKLKALWESLTS